MKDLTEKIVFAIYGLLGAFLGLLVYVVALDGWSFVFTRQASARWNGLGTMLTCCAIGGGWGLVSSKWKDREFTPGPLFCDPASAHLSSKRLMLLATSIAAVYFIWQVARSA